MGCQLSDIAEALCFTSQPIVSVFVPGNLGGSTLNVEFDGVAPAEVRSFVLEREDPNWFPYSHVTEYELVFEELPGDLHSYLGRCLLAASNATGTVVWLGFEGSFHFDNLFTNDVASQIYGVCAPGGEPVVATDLETLKTAAWRSVISSFRDQI
jgi:hypothetical protein